MYRLMHVCMVICFSYSQIYLFKFFTGPLQEWFRVSYEGTAQVFISFIRFLLYSLILNSFLVLLKYSFFLFFIFFTSTCLLVSASNIPEYLHVSFFWAFWCFSWFGSLIPSVTCRFPLFITSMVHFSVPNSIPMSWLFILTACIRVFNYFSFLTNSFISSM